MTQTREPTEERRRQIVSAARKITAARGMQVLTIREIAKEVGISEGDVYRHFPSKKDIIVLLIEDIEKTLLDTVERAAAEKSGALESLGNVLKAHLSYIEQRRGISLIVICEIVRLADKDLRRRMFEVINRYLNAIEELLARGVKSGQIRQDVDLSTAALTFFALVHATVTLWALSNSSFSLAKKNKLLWASYIAGLAGRDHAGKTQKTGTNHKDAPLNHRSVASAVEG
jgi:AcrR family transcriptional regulator